MDVKPQGRGQGRGPIGSLLMEIIPAIDIKDGRCVRLRRGDFSRETMFGDNPADVAKRWEIEGFSRLHVVDLDGAKDGKRVNASAVQKIAENVSMNIQLGGGIRTLSDAEQVLDIGVERLIFGTAAVESPEIVRDAVKRFGVDRLVVSVDAKNGELRTWGWLQSGGNRTPEEFIAEMYALGVVRFIYTDTERDGELGHPDFDAASRLSVNRNYRIIVAGGVSSLEDILELERIGVEGAVIGMAAYTGAIDMKKALSTIRDPGDA